MIDIETLSTEFDAVIISVAAVRFDLSTGERESNDFYCRIDKQSCVDVGLKIDPETVDWWMNQEDNARNEFLRNNDRYSLQESLKKLSVFIPKNAKVWSNGSTFDLVIIRNAYKVCKMDLPWEFFNERDVRTLSDLIPSIKANEPFIGTKHNPLWDCFHQIKYCSKVYQKLKFDE